MPDDPEMLAGWTARPRPGRTPMEGRYARLEPLDVARHGEDLWRAFAGHDDLWTYLGYGPFADRDAFMAWLAGEVVSDDPLSYAVIDKLSGLALGRVTLMEIRPAHGVIETGHIVFSPVLKRSRIATEAIYLQVKRAFDELGYRRFEWKCNDRNEPSKRAAVRFGFTPEGVFRNHMVIKGASRDTAWFSITDDEWPVRRAAFERWLDPNNFDAGGRQRISFSAFSLIAAKQNGVALRRADQRDVAAIEALTNDAYTPNETVIEAVSMPRTWDYGARVVENEIWLAEQDGRLDAALVLEIDGDFTLASIAVAPHAQGRKLGEALLAFTDARARALGRQEIRLYTNEKLVRQTAWYTRHGYRTARIEDMHDRRLIHMTKTLD